MARVTYQYIKDLRPGELGKMSKSQLADLLRKVRAKTNTRLEQLGKVENIYSPAKEVFEANVEQKPVSKMSRNSMIHEILEHQSFHQAKTSTVAGARKVATEQDIRIFGAGKSGRPRHRMTVEQRAKFWSVYEEFQRTYKNAEYLYGSNRIQQYLGDMVLKNRLKTGNNISVEDLSNLLNVLQESIEEQEDEGDYEYGDANVFSGNRSD